MVNEMFWSKHVKTWIKQDSLSANRLVCLVEDEKEYQTIQNIVSKYDHIGHSHVNADEWIMNPDKKIVIVGMHDDLFSRALGRGYGVKPHKWHISFGLLNNHAKWIMKNPPILWYSLSHLHKKFPTHKVSSNIRQQIVHKSLPIQKLFNVSDKTNVDITDYMNDKPMSTKTVIARHVACDDWVTLAKHSTHTAGIMQRFQKIIPAKLVNELCVAAQYHDGGKAHPTFQNNLLEGLEHDEYEFRTKTIWAKRRPRVKLKNITYSHEITGACLLLTHHPAFILASYLVMAHHGRFYSTIDDVSDSLPKIDLGNGKILERTSFTMKGTKWKSLFQQLCDLHGPFILSYCEALLRVADMRASDA